MGALAKMSYQHLDNSVITSADLIGVLSRMPFTAYEDENKTSHRLLVEQWSKADSVLHTNGIEASARDALKRISEYQGEATIISHETKIALSQLQF